MKNIKDCKGGHCVFGFPQFRRFDRDDLIKEINDIIAMYNSLAAIYGRPHSQKEKEEWLSDIETKKAEYSKILKFLEGDNSFDRFVEACDMFTVTSDDDDRKFYIDRKGTVARFIPCCG